MNKVDSHPAAPVLPSMGERIKAVRRNWQWSQQEMARALKVDQASISFWERDVIRPSGSSLTALASLFRVSVEALMEGRNFQLPDSPSHPSVEKGDRKMPRSVCLPANAGHALMVVDLLDGSFRNGGLSEALISLSQGLQENRRAWVVLE